MANYTDKNAGDPWLAADGNALADDIGSPSTGHQHDGSEGHGTILPDVIGDGVGITIDGRILLDKGADISSVGAQLIPLGGGNFFDVTGTTTITSIATLQAGTVLWFQFDGALLLTHNATSLILEGGVNRTTEAKDIHGFVSLGSGNWSEISRLLQTPSAAHTLASHSDTDLGTDVQADQTAIEAETDENTYIPPDLAHYGDWATKGLVNITAAGAADGGINYNLASLTDTGTGDRTIVHDEDFSDGDAQGSVGSQNRGTVNEAFFYFNTRAVGSVQHLTEVVDGTATDLAAFVATWGDH